MRIGLDLPRKLLIEHEPARRLGRLQRCQRSAFYRRVRIALARLVAAPYRPPLPEDGDLLLLADGLWMRFKCREWVLYNLALRPVAGDTAYFLDPLLLPGKESGVGWRRTIDSGIPESASGRIRALVADGLRGGHRIADEHDWVYQRCHWHLLAALNGLRGIRRKGVRGREVREAIYQAVREVLMTTDEQRVVLLCEDIRRLIQNRCCYPKFRYLVGGLLRHLHHFRAYVRHPELRLPTTMGALESMHACMRVAVARVNSPAAALLRVRSYIRLHPTITCREHANPQN